MTPTVTAYATSSKSKGAKTNPLATSTPMQQTMAVHAPMLKKVLTAITTASTIPTPMVYAMNLKSQDVKMLTHVTTTQMQQTMTVRARMPKKVTIVMEFASVTQTVTAYAMWKKLLDVQLSMHVTTMQQQPITMMSPASTPHQFLIVRATVKWTAMKTAFVISSKTATLQFAEKVQFGTRPPELV